MSDTIDPVITDAQDAQIQDAELAGAAFGLARPERVTPPVAAGLDVAGQQRLAEELVEQARAQGLDLAGPGGLLAQLTKRVLETALEAEMAEHLGYEAARPRAATAGTPATGAAPRPSLPAQGPSRSRSRGTGTARSSR